MNITTEISGSRDDIEKYFDYPFLNQDSINKYEEKLSEKMGVTKISHYNTSVTNQGEWHINLVFYTEFQP